MGEGKPQIKEAEPVTEHKGLCAVCRRRKVLGNGLCVECWDEHDGQYPVLTRKEFFNTLRRACRPVRSKVHG